MLPRRMHRPGLSMLETYRGSGSGMTATLGHRHSQSEGFHPVQPTGALEKEDSGGTGSKSGDEGRGLAWRVSTPATKEQQLWTCGAPLTPRGRIMANMPSSPTSLGHPLRARLLGWRDKETKTQPRTLTFCAASRPAFVRATVPRVRSIAAPLDFAGYGGKRWASGHCLPSPRSVSGLPRVGHIAGTNSYAYSRLCGDSMVRVLWASGDAPSTIHLPSIRRELDDTIVLT